MNAKLLNQLLILTALVFVSSAAFASCNNYRQLSEGLYQQDVNGTIVLCSPGDTNGLLQCQTDYNKLVVDYNNLDQNTGHLFNQITTCNQTNAALLQEANSFHDEKDGLLSQISDMNVQVAAALAAKTQFETEVKSLSNLCGDAKSFAESTKNDLVDYKTGDANQANMLLQQQAAQLTTCQAQNNTINDMALALYFFAFVVFFLLAAQIVPRLRERLKKRKEERDREKRLRERFDRAPPQPRNFYQGNPTDLPEETDYRDEPVPQRRPVRKPPASRPPTACPPTAPR